MGIVTQRAHGFIYEDVFDSLILNPGWELYPSNPDRLTLSTGRLQLNHGAEPAYLFFSQLSDEKQFVLDVKNLYNPVTPGDVGGIVVFGDSDDFISIDEYYDEVAGVSKTYPWIRLVRDYNTYTAYWSEDGVIWHFIGVQHFDRLTPKIGLFLEGTSGDDFRVEHVRVMRSTKLTLGNLTAGTLVSLLNSQGDTVDTQVCRTAKTTVVFDVSKLPLPFEGRFAITLGASTTEEPLNLKMWGGDSFSLELGVDLYFEDDQGVDVLLNTNIEEFLGYLNSGDQAERLAKLKLKNPLPGSFNSVTVQLTEYNSTDHYQRLVSLAENQGGTPGTFTDQVTIAQVVGGSEEVVWLKMQREYDPHKYTSAVYFGLSVASAYVAV